MDHAEESLRLHLKHGGKLEIVSKFPLISRDDLAIAYTPGVAAVCARIASQPDQAYQLTIKGNTIAIVSNGSAVLGLGDIGPAAALPVMEGKAILFKAFGDINGVPLVLAAHEAGELIAVVKAIAPTFGGINLEDIAAPICFEVEAGLQDLGIPVFHDDQHGTAVVLLAALINASRVIAKNMADLKVVISGAGAAGTAIARMLGCAMTDGLGCVPVSKIYVCDSRGLIHRERQDLNRYKRELLTFCNPDNRSGSLRDILKNADVFIGVSVGDLLGPDDIRLMADQSIVFAMANPVPEIMPDLAKAAGAAVVGTGRSDFPNQVNNVLAFPGIFRGALAVRATRITDAMKMAAARTLAAAVAEPTADKILPDPLTGRHLSLLVGEAVAAAAVKDGVARAIPKEQD
jgi:malate dehydrogenase (oxaloacetate-decarboxylating)